MSSKASKGRGVSAHEVSSARSKLDGVLQTLVDKKEDSPSQDEGELQIKIEPDTIKEPLPAVSPKKGSSSKPQRKRRRKEEPNGTELGHYHHTYVMKLFDRSVDLAQFDEETPLYPICRAWMRNQPHNTNLAPRERTPTPEPPGEDDTEDDKPQDVYKLPPAVPIKMEFGETYRDPRIIDPPDHSKVFIDIYGEPENAPAPESLLLNHMARWKEVRQRWKDSSQVNEARYSEGLKILKDIFDRQCKD